MLFVLQQSCIILKLPYKNHSVWALTPETFAARSAAAFKIGDYIQSTREDEVWIAEENLSRPMTLKVPMDNPKAFSFYEKHG